MVTPYEAFGPPPPSFLTAKPLNLLFVGDWGLSLDLAWQAQREGHHAKLSIHDADCKDIGDNIVPKSENWETDVAWADVVVFDDTGYGRHQDRLRKEGKPVVGGSELGDRLEDDRDFGRRVLKDLDVPTLESRDFTDFGAAREWIGGNPGRYVLKPNGAAADFKGLAYASRRRDSSDLLERMTNLQLKWPKNLKPDFQLQKFAQGVEVAVGAFFNGKDWVLPLCVNFEHKRLFTGNIGPLTGEMGTTILWEPDPANRLFQDTLARVKPLLAESDYHGYIDINCIANESGAWPLEFTCRFGYPLLQIQTDGFRVPMGHFVEQLARGTLTNVRVDGRFSLGVVLAVPPFPFTSKPEFDRYSRDLPVFGMTKDRIDHVRLAEVKWDPGSGGFLTANESGYTLVATGTGETMEEAKRRAYGMIGDQQGTSGVFLPNMMYRTDIGDRWATDEPLLRQWGYVGGQKAATPAPPR